MARYSDINNAARLERARIALAAYRANPPEPRIGSLGPQDERKDIFVTPFGFDLPVDEVAQSTVSVNDYPAMAAIINQASSQSGVTDTLGAKEVARLFRYTPARVVWFRNVTVSFIQERSVRTNQPYRKYAGDSLRCAFGRKSADDNIYDAFSQLKTRIRAVGGFKMSRVSLTHEKVTQR